MASRGQTALLQGRALSQPTYVEIDARIRPLVLSQMLGILKIENNVTLLNLFLSGK